MSLVTINSTLIEGFVPNPKTLTTVEMRIYCDTPFAPFGANDEPVQSGNLGSSSWYRSYVCNVIGNDVALPEVVLPATLNGEPATARYSVGFFAPSEQVRAQSIELFRGLQGFRLPDTPSTTTWQEIFLANDAGSPFEPEDGLISRPDASGTNIAGADLDFAGGPGTGNATPGTLAVRYPLVGASGSVVQTLSLGRFPLAVNMFSITSL